MFLARHRVLVIAVVLVSLAGGAFILTYFEPQKLFVDQRVDEAAPSEVDDTKGKGDSRSAADQASDLRAQGQPGQSRVAVPAVLVQGGFRSLEHQTTGEAIVSQLPDGSRVLRLENFETSNGPDLRVYLSAGSNDAAFGREYGKDFVELGVLKGNLGSQNYSVPAGIDLAKYRNAVIWCKRFSVGFGVATLR
jgi:hypothetical protein